MHQKDVKQPVGISVGILPHTKPMLIVDVKREGMMDIGGDRHLTVTVYARGRLFKL
jgi:hypothetical protein